MDFCLSLGEDRIALHKQTEERTMEIPVPQSDESVSREIDTRIERCVADLREKMDNLSTIPIMKEEQNYIASIVRRQLYEPGFINLFPEDVERILDGAKAIYVATGKGYGQRKAEQVADAIRSNPQFIAARERIDKALMLFDVYVAAELEEIEGVAMSVTDDFVAWHTACTSIAVQFDESLDDCIRITLLLAES